MSATEQKPRSGSMESSTSITQEPEFYAIPDAGVQSKTCADLLKTIQKSKQFSAAEHLEQTSDHELFDPIKSVADLYFLLEQIDPKIVARVLQRFVQMNYESAHLAFGRVLKGDFGMERRTVESKIKSFAELNLLVHFISRSAPDLLKTLFERPGILSQLQGFLSSRHGEAADLSYFLSHLSGSPYTVSVIHASMNSPSSLVSLLQKSKAKEVSPLSFDPTALFADFMRIHEWDVGIFIALMHEMKTAGLGAHILPLLRLYAGHQNALEGGHISTLAALVSADLEDEAKHYLHFEAVDQSLCQTLISAPGESAEKFAALMSVVRSLVSTGLKAETIIEFLEGIPISNISSNPFVVLNAETIAPSTILNAGSITLPQLTQFIGAFQGSLPKEFFAAIAAKVQGLLYQVRGLDEQAKDFIQALKAHIESNGLLDILLAITKPGLAFDERDEQYLSLLFEEGFKSAIGEGEAAALQALQILDHFNISSFVAYQRLKALFDRSFPALVENAALKFKFNTLLSNVESINGSAQEFLYAELLVFLKALQGAQLWTRLAHFINQPTVLTQIKTIDQGIEVLRCLKSPVVGQTMSESAEAVLINHLISKISTQEELIQVLAIIAQHSHRTKAQQEEAALRQYLESLDDPVELLPFARFLAFTNNSIFRLFSQQLEAAAKPMDDTDYKRDQDTRLLPAMMKASPALSIALSYALSQVICPKIMDATYKPSEPSVMKSNIQGEMRSQIEKLIHNFLGHDGQHEATRSTKAMLKELKNFTPNSSHLEFIDRMKAILKDSNHRNERYEQSWFFRLFHRKRSPEAEALYCDIYQRLRVMLKVEKVIMPELPVLPVSVIGEEKEGQAEEKQDSSSSPKVASVMGAVRVQQQERKGSEASFD